MGFTRFTKNVLNVSALPDRVQNQASTLKATFDQAGVDIKTALNALIVELEAATSANNIGADVTSVTTKTVQAILAAFEERIADRYTKTETETLVANDTNNLVSDVDVNLTTGVITITKKDGTTVTFDTALEKVPAKFEIVENGDTYALKITNQDGTVTQADITQFMNVYNFNNSDEVAFEVNETGNKKTVTASIRANSIGLDKLSLSVVSTLEGYMTSAKDSAAAAKTSETNARTSELNAQTAANTALNKASEATTAANTATSKASAAEKSAEDAEYWAKQAEANGGGGGGITEIPIATADTLGGIKVGEGLEITEDGVLRTLGKMGKVTTLLNERTTNLNTGYTLTDGIDNYDLIIVQASIPADDGLKTTVTLTDVTIGKSYAMGNCLKASGSNSYFLTFKFSTSTTIVQGIREGEGDQYWTGVSIERVYGIKLGGNYVINGEEFEVDNAPTEGSKQLVSSGGVKAYVDTAVSSKADTTYVDEQVATKATITYGTTDLTAGTSTLATGNVYLVYE
jgi:hypothetical protein